MPTTPYAKLLVSVNGAGTTSGGLTVPGAATIALTGESVAAWESARFEIYAYPPGWGTPSGWTLDGTTGIIYSTSFTPSTITLEAAATRWGKWLARLIVNNGTKNGVGPQYYRGLIQPSDVVDTDVTGWQVLSPLYGFQDVGVYEDGQFNALLKYVAALQYNFHALEGSLANGQGAKALKTTDATVTTVQTYAMPDNSSVVVEAYAVAKKPTTATTSFFGYRHMFVRNGGAPAAVGVLEDIGTRQNGTTWAMDIAISSNNILTRVTGQAATNIEWQTIVKILPITDTTI